MCIRDRPGSRQACVSVIVGQQVVEVGYVIVRIRNQAGNSIDASCHTADEQPIAIIEPLRFADDIVVLSGCEEICDVGNAVVVFRLQRVELAVKSGLRSLCVEEAEPEVTAESSELLLAAESESISPEIAQTTKSTTSMGIGWGNREQEPQDCKCCPLHFVPRPQLNRVKVAVFRWTEKPGSAPRFAGTSSAFSSHPPT